MPNCSFQKQKFWQAFFEQIQGENREQYVIVIRNVTNMDTKLSQ